MDKYVHDSDQQSIGEKKRRAKARHLQKLEALRLVAVIVALGNDFSVIVLKEGGEVGAHSAACWDCLKGNREYAGPVDFKGNLVTAG